MIDGSGPGVGVIGQGDLKVSAGLGMSSLIAPGRCRIRAINALSAPSGLYELLNDAQLSRVHQPADGTNPRIDQIIAKVVDFQEQQSPIVEDIVIVSGIPTAAATLDNRNGVSVLPVNSLLLADSLIPVGAGNAALFSYRDRRQSFDQGRIPPVRTLMNAVPFMSYLGREVLTSMNISTGIQCAELRYLPRRITATKIRWVYRQGATPAAGNYRFGIYDSSGRKIVETGSTAWTGSANSTQMRAETIAATTFEAGAYYVVVGWGTTTGSAPGLLTFNGTTNFMLGPGPNYIVVSNTGTGTTLPQVLNTGTGGLSDYYGIPRSSRVPVISMSEA